MNKEKYKIEQDRFYPTNMSKSDFYDSVDYNTSFCKYGSYIWFLYVMVVMAWKELIVNY